jgi:outer membrane protein TolC
MSRVSQGWIAIWVAIFLDAQAHAGDLRKLTLEEAVQLAISQNRALKIARLKVTEAEQRKAEQRSSYFPILSDHARADENTGIDHVSIPAGALGRVDGTLVPDNNINLPQGRKNLLLNQATVSQPLTQLIRVHQANLIAAVETSISRDELKKAENQVALDVHNLYFGILIARLQKQAAEQQSTYAAEQLRESENDFRAGNALRVATMEGEAELLEGRQAVLTADLQITDLNTEFDNLLGLPLDTQLDLNPIVQAAPELRPKEEYVQNAWEKNPDIAAAEDTVRKAKAAVAVAKTAYIPDVSAYFTNTWQDGVSFLVRNFSTVGAQLNWDVFDFGKRRATVRERGSQLAQAEENLRRLKDDVATDIERSYDKLIRTKSLIEVAKQVASLRQESERLAQNQLTQGVVTISDQRRASSATYKSKADLLQANLNYLVAWAELQRATGQSPALQQSTGGGNP